MIALFRFLNALEILLKLLFFGKRSPIDTNEHFVLLIAAPVGARNGSKLHRLDRRGIGHMRSRTKVREFPLTEEAQFRILRQIADQLHLIRLALFLHEPDGFLSWKRIAFELEVFLDDFLHLRLDGGDILVRKRGITVKIVIKAVLDRRTDRKLCLRIKALHRLRKNMRGRMPQCISPQLLFKIGFNDAAVVFNDLHNRVPFSACCGLKNQKSTQDRFSGLRCFARFHSRFHSKPR